MIAIIPTVEFGGTNAQHDSILRGMAAWYGYGVRQCIVLDHDRTGEIYRELMRTFPGLLVIPGVGVNSWLSDDFNDLGGWRALAEYVATIKSELMQPRYWAEFENVFNGATNAEYPVDADVLRLGLRMLPPGMICYPPPVGVGATLQLRYQWFTLMRHILSDVNVLTYSDRSDPDSLDARKWQTWVDGARVRSMPIIYSWPNNPLHWRAEEFPGLLARIQAERPQVTEVAWEPGVDAFGTQSEAFVQVLARQAASPLHPPTGGIGGVK